LGQNKFSLNSFCYKVIHSACMYCLAYCTVHECEKLAWDENVLEGRDIGVLS